MKKAIVRSCLVLLLFATVQQAGAQCSSVFFNPGSVNFPYTGGMQSVEVVTSGFCSVTILAQPSWVTTSNTGSFITVSANQNNGTARGGSVSVSYDVNGSTTFGSININQAGFVLPVPQITQHPTNKNVCEGVSITFSVRATNATAYQWWESTNNGISFSLMTGKTAQDLTFTTTRLTSPYFKNAYRCVVSNSAGSVTSNAATLVVTEKTVIASHPTDVKLCGSGQSTATFSVGAAGTSYRWEFSTDGGNNYVTWLDQPNGPTLIVQDAWSRINQKFRCVVTGTCGGGTSQGGTILAGDTFLSVTTSPNQTLCAGQQAEFSVGTSGTVVSYQWQEATSISTDFHDITGANAAFLRFTPGEDKKNYKYRCVVYGPCVSQISGASTLSFFDQSIGLVGPFTQTVCRGAQATFHVQASSAAVLTYQWEWRPNAAAAFTPLLSEKTDTYRMTATEETRGYEYRCIISGSCGYVVTTQTAALDFVDNPIEVWKQPGELVYYCPSRPLTFLIESPTPLVIYQWQVKVPGGAFVDMTGATAATYTFTPTIREGGNVYRCRLTRECYTTKYTPDTQIVFRLATNLIRKQPQDQTVCRNSAATFEVWGNYSFIQYQWQESVDNGMSFTDLPGEQHPTLKVLATPANENRRYRCVVTQDGCTGTAFTQVVKLNVFTNPATTATVTKNIDPVYNDDAVTLTVSGGALQPGDQWEWFVRYNGSYTILGQGPSVVVIPNQNSTYYVRSTACGIDGAANMTIQLLERFSGDRNYIHRIVPREALDYAQIYAANAERFHESIVYYDGLGRPMQDVKFRQSPTGRDMVTPIAYDAIGRKERQHLPYTGETTGKYKEDALAGDGGYVTSAQYIFYNGEQATIPHDTVPFTRTVFEASPLDRTLKVYGPGQRWGRAEADKPTTAQYTLNTNGQTGNAEQIVFWRMRAGLLEKAAGNTPLGVDAEGRYGSDQLSVQVGKDEQGFQTRQYSNKKNQVVAKKVQVVQGAVVSNNDHWAITYYVYDERDNLVAVVPPEGSKALLGQ
jgi:hypothetical protein